jgi:hypothetical protein
VLPGFRAIGARNNCSACGVRVTCMNRVYPRRGWNALEDRSAQAGQSHAPAAAPAKRDQPRKEPSRKALAGADP